MSKDVQSGKEAASCIPMLNDRSSSWHSRSISSVIGVSRKVFMREDMRLHDDCERFAEDDRGRWPKDMILD